ncbi:hypothetical protein [Streptomyces sp. NPDC026673]|uniref:hypothetical protein n=1 Tax=Streptomyces sp. NPDC026673 TaxID=3155724 RepID=UPI0033FEF27B
MKTIKDFVSVLGAPIRQAERPLIEDIASSWSVPLPDDFAEIAGAYGDVVISEFILLCGSRSLQPYSSQMGRLLAENPKVPHPVLPTPNGALLWGNTIEGDQLFLVPRANGQWTVSAFRRGWGDWHDTDLGFSDWLYLALTGKTATDWLPEWEPLPHPLEIID